MESAVRNLPGWSKCWVEVDASIQIRACFQRISSPSSTRAELPHVTRGAFALTSVVASCEPSPCKR